HIIECGAQASGGNFTRWGEGPGLETVGYPIVEAHPDGAFFVTKPPRTGGLVSGASVTGQILYEMGGPAPYVSGGGGGGFRTIRLEQAGPDRVRVFGIEGMPETDTYKVSVSYLNGFKASGQLTISGPFALEKAGKCATIVWEKLAMAGVRLEETSTELL